MSRALLLPAIVLLSIPAPPGGGWTPAADSRPAAGVATVAAAVAMADAATGALQEPPQVAPQQTLPSDSSTAAGVAPGAGRLSLAALLVEAETNAPILHAARSRVAEAETLPDQAGALPDPIVETSFQNESLDEWTLGDTQMSNITLTWSQEMPWRGKRGLRSESARAGIDVAAAEEARLRSELRSLVKEAYIELHRIERVRALVGESRRLLESLRDSAMARFEAGEAPLEGVLGAGAEVARLDGDLARLDGERAEAEARLARLLGRQNRESFGDAVEPPVAAPVDPAEIERSAATGSTRVHLLRAMSRRAGADIEELRLELRPDWMWSAGYAYRGDLDPMIMGGVGVRLPLWRDRKQALAVAGAERAREAVEYEARDAEAEAIGEIREALARAAAAEARALVLEEGVVPQGRAALEAAAAAWATGRGDFGTILGYARDLLDDGGTLEELRAQRLTALALIEPFAGRDLVLPAGESR